MENTSSHATSNVGRLSGVSSHPLGGAYGNDLRIYTIGTGFSTETEDASSLVSLGGHHDQTQTVMREEERLQQLRQREVDVRQLESDINAVNQITIGLATIVKNQGELTDSIEGAIVNTERDVINGTQHLKKASAGKDKARRRKFCLYAFLVIVLIIAISVIAYELS